MFPEKFYYENASTVRRKIVVEKSQDESIGTETLKCNRSDNFVLRRRIYLKHLHEMKVNCNEPLTSVFRVIS